MGVVDGAVTGSFLGPWGAVIGAGLGLFGNLFGAHEQASSANHGADLQAQAARYAADVNARAQAEALAFLRSQSENAYQNSETSRHGNYDQWAARERRLGSIGEALGYGNREVPGYVAGVDPKFVGSGATDGAMAASGGVPTYGANTGATGMPPQPGTVGYYLAQQQQPQQRYLPLPMARNPYAGSVGSYL